MIFCFCFLFFCFFYKHVDVKKKYFNKVDATFFFVYNCVGQIFFFSISSTPPHTNIMVHPLLTICARRSHHKWSAATHHLSDNSQPKWSADTALQHPFPISSLLLNNIFPPNNIQQIYFQTITLLTNTIGNFTTHL